MEVLCLKNHTHIKTTLIESTSLDPPSSSPPVLSGSQAPHCPPTTPRSYEHQLSLSVLRVSHLPAVSHLTAQTPLQGLISAPSVTPRGRRPLHTCSLPCPTHPLFCARLQQGAMVLGMHPNTETQPRPLAPSFFASLFLGDHVGQCLPPSVAHTVD